MKVDHKTYAQLLSELTEGVEKEKLDEILSKFVNLLKKNGHTGMIDEIISEFYKVFNKREKIEVVEVTFAHDVDEEMLDQIEEFIKEELGTKKIEVEKKLDRKLLGGLKIQVGDMVLDASLKTKIKRLKQGFLIK